MKKAPLGHANRLRRRLGELLDRVRIRQEPIVVQTYQTPQAVLIPCDDLEAYQAWRERGGKRAAWLSELRDIAEEVSQRPAISDPQAAALIDEASVIGLRRSISRRRMSVSSEKGDLDER